jgi:hypothetical protein
VGHLQISQGAVYPEFQDFGDKKKQKIYFWIVWKTLGPFEEESGFWDNFELAAPLVFDELLFKPEAIYLASVSDSFCWCRAENMREISIINYVIKLFSRVFHLLAGYVRKFRIGDIFGQSGNFPLSKNRYKETFHRNMSRKFKLTKQFFSLHYILFYEIVQ